MFNVTDEILNSVTINDVLNQYGFKVNKGFIKCPFHVEDTASCRIYNSNNSFYCFGCGSGGNVISFVAKLLNKSNGDAVRIINEDFNLNLPIDRKPTLKEKYEIEKRIAERKEKEKLIQHEKTKSFEEYLDLQTEYLRLKQNIVKYKPIDQDSPLNPLFVEAVQNIETVEFKLNQVESRVINFAV